MVITRIVRRDWPDPFSYSWPQAQTAIVQDTRGLMTTFVGGILFIDKSTFPLLYSVVLFAATYSLLFSLILYLWFFFG